MKFLRRLKSITTINASSILLGIFFILIYLARPVSLPIINPENLLKSSGMAKFTKLPATKSSPSEILFDVADTRIYCGIGIIQGNNGCFYIEDLIDIKRNVSVSYFLMTNRFGFKYPVLYSLEQEGVEKITPQLAYERLQISIRSTWKSYHTLLFLFGFSALFLIAIDKLKTSSPSNKRK